MNNFYQMDTTNQLPRSSGPPRTNAKGMYENPQSSIPVSQFSCVLFNTCVICICS